MTCIEIRGLLLCALMTLETVAQAQMTNPPPSKPFASFKTFELKMLEVASPKMDAKFNTDNDNVVGRLQSRITTLIGPIVAEWNQHAAETAENGLVITALVEDAQKVSPARRMLSPFAGDSYALIKLRCVADPGGEVVAEPEFYQKTSKWNGANWGGIQDYAMIDRVVKQIAEYMRANYARAVGGPTGREK